VSEYAVRSEIVDRCCSTIIRSCSASCLLPSCLYRLADPHPRWRIGTLVLLSLIFYSYWNPPFILLLALSILVNWLAMRAYAMTNRRRS